MTKTRTEVVNQAYRRLGIVAVDQVASADEIAYGGNTLDALFAELKASDGITVTWDLSAVPDTAFIPLANLLAVEVAPAYMQQAPERRGSAFIRLRKVLSPDDRPNDRDRDEDGTVTEAEIEAQERAVYY